MSWRKVVIKSYILCVCVFERERERVIGLAQLTDLLSYGRVKMSFKTGYYINHLVSPVFFLLICPLFVYGMRIIQV